MSNKTKSLLWFVILAIICILFPSSSYAQGGRTDNVVFKVGVGVGGVNVAVCQALTTTAASVTSNIATYTMSSNPQTAGFVAGMQIQVSGFTGGDTYFNAGTIANSVMTGGQLILSVTPTTINTTLVHANASASSNGQILQFGNSTTPCAGLSILYTDSTLGTVSTNPIVSDGLGNVGFWAAPGQYIMQYYGATVTTQLKYASVSCVPGNTVNCGAFTNANNTFTGVNTFSNINNTLYVDGTKYTTIAAALAALPGCTDNSGSYSACGQIVVPPGSYTVSSEIDIGPHVWIRGSGPVNTHIVWTGTVSGTCAFSYTGFTIAGTSFNTGWGQASGGIQDLDIQGDSSAGVCGIHWTDIQGMKITNVSVHDFTGTAAAGLWQDATNTPSGGNPGWTERSNISAWSYNNTIDWHRTNNVAAASSQVTIGYGDFDVKLNVFSGQTAIQQENGALAGAGSYTLDSYSRFHIVINGDGNANETGIVMNNTALLIKSSGSVHMEGLTGVGSKGFNMISAASAFGMVGNVDNVGATANVINSSNYNVVSEEFSTGGSNDFLALGDDQACYETNGVSVLVCAGASSGFSPFGISKGGLLEYYFDSSGNFYAHQTQANTANRTYTWPDVTGTVEMEPTTYLKNGSGAGNYTGVNTAAFANVDTTNLCQVVTIPTGWKLIIQAAGDFTTNTGAVVASVGITDVGTTCAGAGVTPLKYQPLTPSGISANMTFSLLYVLNGDGAAHSISLQAETTNAADAWSIQNSSVPNSPSIILQLVMSN